MGALNCRAGFMAESAADLPPAYRDYVERLVAPYFEAAAAWYETVGIGVTGGEILRGRHVSASAIRSSASASIPAT